MPGGARKARRTLYSRRGPRARWRPYFRLPFALGGWFERHLVLKLTLFRGDLILTRGGIRDVQDPAPPYPAEFREQIVELARAGRTPAEARA
jgi:hypothetical protein